MMHRTHALHLVVLVLVMAGGVACDASDPAPPPTETVTADFADQPAGWVALFSNYYPARADDYQLESGYQPLPAPLDTTQSGFYLSGTNRSDDLNMFLKHRVDGLTPETTYEVAFEVAFATKVPSGCAGVGGSPGEGVTVHAAATSIEPDRVIEDVGQQPYYWLSVVTRYTGDNWYRATELGNIANSRSCEDDAVFEIKRLRSARDHGRVTTDSAGRAWLLIGTRSGFEATTHLYYTEVKASFYQQ